MIAKLLNIFRLPPSPTCQPLTASIKLPIRRSSRNVLILGAILLTLQPVNPPPLNHPFIRIRHHKHTDTVTQSLYHAHSLCRRQLTDQRLRRTPKLVPYPFDPAHQVAVLPRICPDRHSHRQLTLSPPGPNLSATQIRTHQDDVDTNCQHAPIIARSDSLAPLTDHGLRPSLTDQGATLPGLRPRHPSPHERSSCSHVRRIRSATSCRSWRGYSVNHDAKGVVGVMGTLSPFFRSAPNAIALGSTTYRSIARTQRVRSYRPARTCRFISATIRSSSGDSQHRS